MNKNTTRPPVDLPDFATAPGGLPYAVHFGVPYLHVIEALRRLRRSREAVRADGDGWFVWAEALGQAGNDDTTFHVVASTTNVVRTLRMIVSLGVPLVELGQRGCATRPGVVVIVTDPLDSELDVAEVTEDWLASMTTDWLRRDQWRQSGGIERP
ncbi:hypothetical protein LEP48_00525 [Isoptericola sp. NEAU-Y5]|uniref:Uncharacterized protein n=1 Tax=Isoptericola luteus TaxID=2879484 RepID=A0ABS7ZDZ9_9MICO|nr:hypothetical protein [Isoptericola sp. NEAU-Y5]MCA5891834.1 hypothetical protein [Isoptericola sp. NEAU-Y5]